MKTELEIKMETCDHEFRKLVDMGFEDGKGSYCLKCGCSILGNKMFPATAFVGPISRRQEHGINPLRQNCYKRLERMQLKDLADKVNELTKYLNEKS